MCWNETTVSDEDEVIQDLVQPFDPLAESHDSETYVGQYVGGYVGQ